MAIRRTFYRGYKNRWERVSLSKYKRTAILILDKALIDIQVLEQVLFLTLDFLSLSVKS